MKLSQQQFEAHLWGAANILRGKTAGQDYKNYILSLMFYKRLCDQWKNETEDAIAELEGQQGQKFTEKQKAIFRARSEHRFSIPDGSRWGDILTVSENIGQKLTEAMQNVSNANEELMGFFIVDWNQPAPDASGKKLIPNEVVHALIQHFDEIDLSNKSVPSDVLGRAYEYLIKQFADDAGAKAGESITPPEVVDTLVRILEPKAGDTIANAFRFDLTGTTPIDRTMINTHRDFGTVIDGQLERYLSYYGIKHAIKDGATLEVHYLRDKVPFEVDEKALNVGFEEMCEEMELEDEEAKDFEQRKKSQWKELARHPERIDIVLDKMLKHFLSYPDPSEFKAQLVVIDRRACVKYKDALDIKLKKIGLPPEWSDVIISEGQNDDAELKRFHYSKLKSHELIDYFKLTPKEWENWNKKRHGDDRNNWRPPLKILIVCDRLLTGFDAPIEQVMYLDKPLRDYNLLQAIARTNRPLPTMNKLTGVIVDYFGVFKDLGKALNFDESGHEESLIDWDVLRKSIPGKVERCMELFKDITKEDTRNCLIAALRQLSDPDAAKNFEHNFKSLERFWEALSPDQCLHDYRRKYNLLCGIHLAYKAMKTGRKATYGELSAKTRKLIEENTKLIDIAEKIPIFKIDSDYIRKVEDLPTPADKAAALEAILTREPAEGGSGFTYKKLGERLQRIKERKDDKDFTDEQRLKQYQEIADETVKTMEEPEKLNLTKPGEHELFMVLREHSKTNDEKYIADSARQMIAHLKKNQLLSKGWSNSKGGRMRVEQSLLAESWNRIYSELGFNPDEAEPPFLELAVEELMKADGKI